DILFGLYTKKSIRKASLHNHPSIEYFSFETAKNIEKEQFENLIKNLPKEIYRAKGFVKLNKKFYLFNYVAKRYSLDEFKADKTQLVFIGEKIKEYQKEILEKLNSLSSNQDINIKTTNK
ncbi:MAG: GTP-binding protein, partial [Nanoarchaeota archaeon]